MKKFVIPEVDFIMLDVDISLLGDSSKDATEGEWDMWGDDQTSHS